MNNRRQKLNNQYLNSSRETTSKSHDQTVLSIYFSRSSVIPAKAGIPPHTGNLYNYQPTSSQLIMQQPVISEFVGEVAIESAVKIEFYRLCLRTAFR